MRFKKTAKNNRDTYKYYGCGENGKVCVLYELVPKTEEEKKIVQELHRLDDLWVASNIRTHLVWNMSTISRYAEEIQRKYETATGESMSRKDVLAELQTVYPKWVLRLEARDTGGKPVAPERKTSVLPYDIHLLVNDLVACMDERSQKVYQLLIAGYTQQEIGNKLHVSRRTIVEDIKGIKAELQSNSELGQRYSEYIGKRSLVKFEEEEDH